MHPSRRAFGEVAAAWSGWMGAAVVATLLVLGGTLYWLTELGVVAALGIIAAVTIHSTVLLLGASRLARRADRAHGRLLAKTDDGLASVTQRLLVAEETLNTISRRPWAPTLLPWPETLHDTPVLLLPGADYHLAELVPLARELRERGVEVVVASGRPHWGRIVNGLSWYPDVEVVDLPGPAQVAGRVRAIVTMKDWAGYAPYIEFACDAGIPTFAKVEGVQDFRAVDTPEDVRPYRRAETILCQGANDARVLGEAGVVVGSTRLERLWRAPTGQPSRPLVVVNVNFTGGVLSEARRPWVEGVVEACKSAGLPYVLSLHPAERARSPHSQASPIGISRLLEHATVLVSRFSTAPFEALARGVPFVYYNPHGEQVPDFNEPSEAFQKAHDVTSLVRALEVASLDTPEVVRDRAQQFFLAQVDVDPVQRSEQRGADAILERL